MSKLTAQDVKKIASLANLPLGDAEIAKLSSDLSKTLDYISRLDVLDTTRIKPTYQVSGKVNEFREDKVEKSLPVAEVLKNAKRTYKNFFVVPKVIDK